MLKPKVALRRRLGRALRNSSALREVRADAAKQVRQVDARVDVTDALVKRGTERSNQLSAQVDKQAKELAKLAATVAAIQQSVRPVEQASAIRDLDHLRLTSQVGALEERLGALEERLADGRLVTDETEDTEARRLIDEVRREHEQIRVRMQIIGWYEERLRRVEASVVSLFEGDLRHPI